MMRTGYDPLFWRTIAIASLVVIGVVGAIAIHAIVTAGRKLVQQTRLYSDRESGSCDANHVACSEAPVVRNATAHTAGNDPTRPDPFHKEAA
jgi:hypothetical protein